MAIMTIMPQQFLPLTVATIPPSALPVIVTLGPLIIHVVQASVLARHAQRWLYVMFPTMPCWSQTAQWVTRAGGRGSLTELNSMFKLGA